MSSFITRRFNTTALADMTNTRTPETDATLVNNLPPMMAVSPLIPTVVESTCILPLPEDEKMMAATLAVLETGSLTPLIKEELKCSILTRRLVEGKDEIQVDFTVPEKKQPTPEEEERTVVRREQNRLAAQRFRKKQKDTASFLLKKTQKLTSVNTALRTELDRLRDERDRLQELFKNHLLVCPLNP